MIQEEVLLAYGATFRKYKKNQCIFFEGEAPLFFYQVAEGCVRMANVFDDGKEFIQGIFKKGESFGEPALLIKACYFATAIAMEDSVILKLSKQNFLLLLHDNNEAVFSLTQTLAARLFRKSIIAKEISGENAVHRIETLLCMFKEDSGCPNERRYKIELSRQRIADMLGLRVETVIRAMKKLEEEGTISIKNGKAYL